MQPTRQRRVLIPALRQVDLQVQNGRRSVDREDDGGFVIGLWLLQVFPSRGTFEEGSLWQARVGGMLLKGRIGAQ